MVSWSSILMAKPTTIKLAIANWEARTGQKASEATEVKLYAQYPPIEKMDSGLSLLANCEQFSEHLRVLSLARNNIKTISGLEPVGETLEELWISYNNIEKLKGLGSLKKLRVLYMANNKVKDWSELLRLNDLPSLADLVFVGNPLEEHNQETFRDDAMKKLPRIKKLDGEATFSRFI
ncbi:unnamed protein product [Mesocestoides corti]|uniref:Dynein axonemal light chain 1 n=1 Tax=Mesocestoides corti TaxID=53468 RepID=A0A0R3U3C4_MESCO|nr:unnamed protein product [Mesocestoides corti]